MEIKVSTKIDYEKFKKFYRFNLLKNSRFKEIQFTSVPFLVLITLILMFISGFDFLPVLLFALTLLLFLLITVLVFIIPKSVYKSQLKTFENPNEFTFEETEMKAENTGDGFNEATIIRYDKLEKVYETKEFFYIYINNIQAFIVGKNDFLTGSAEDLSRLLSSVMEQKKYIRCYK